MVVVLATEVPVVGIDVLVVAFLAMVVEVVVPVGDVRPVVGVAVVFDVEGISVVDVVELVSPVLDGVPASRAPSAQL